MLCSLCMGLAICFKMLKENLYFSLSAVYPQPNPTAPPVYGNVPGYEGFMAGGAGMCIKEGLCLCMPG